MASTILADEKRPPDLNLQHDIRYHMKEAVYYSLYDFLRHAKLAPSRQRIVIYESYSNKKVPNLVPQGSLLGASKKQRATPMLPWEDALEFLCFCLRRCRKAGSHIENVLRNLGTSEDMFQFALPGTTEDNILELLDTALPYKMIPQFRCGSYRIDAYFPELRIAIACDEFGHKGYHQEQETDRQRFLEEALQCIYIRFDPFEEDFSIFKVIRKILLVLASERYERFRRKLPILPPTLNKDDETSEEDSEEETVQEEKEETNTITKT